MISNHSSLDSDKENDYCADNGDLQTDSDLNLSDFMAKRMGASETFTGKSIAYAKSKTQKLNLQLQRKRTYTNVEDFEDDWENKSELSIIFDEFAEI